MKTMLSDNYENILFETIFENKAEQNAVLNKVEKNQNDLEKLQEIAKGRSNEIVCKIKDFNKKMENTKRAMDSVKRLAEEKRTFTNKFKRFVSIGPIDWGVSDEDMDKARDRVLGHTVESLGEVAELVQESVMFSCCTMAFSQCMLKEFNKRFEEEMENLTADFTETNEKTTKAIGSIIEGILEFHKRQEQFDSMESKLTNSFNRHQEAINILFEETENLQQLLQKSIEAQQIGINTLSEKTDNLEKSLQQTRQNQDEHKTNIQNIESFINTQNEMIETLQDKCTKLEEISAKIEKTQKISLILACVALVLSIVGIIAFFK